MVDTHAHMHILISLQPLPQKTHQHEGDEVGGRVVAEGVERVGLLAEHAPGNLRGRQRVDDPVFVGVCGCVCVCVWVGG